ncbi:myosin heavy chain, striated muscle [Senna tora]|uniref:Myosin heavy chain, striated muscle n=1 Tax=Senna tora TaxID=362788 RepID=A0A834TFK9_9FABA|nr:myosin heavy chain, striated muscle [Senna tora]
MEESNAMTIEFLRARLLSERSVSRSARQRADELAKKVMELEEQLKLVSLQRKMAEKATADVLAILENQGITDFSEEFDLGSDEEMPYESGVGNDSTKGDERSMSSKGRRRDSNELSGSEIDSSPVTSRSLSWKGRVNSPGSFEKYKNYNVRRRSSFSSISSPKHRLGRSCRQIKCRETKSVVEEPRNETVNGQENDVVCSSEGFSNCSDGGSDILRIESIIQEKGKSELKLANDNHNVDEYGKDRDMEKALEHQAQLIGQYEAMEKAQREWEEKFRENNNSTPDSCDPGNFSDITDEREESKAQTPSSARAVTLDAREAKSEARDVCISENLFKAEPIDNLPKTHDDTGGYHHKKRETHSSSDLPTQENSNSVLKVNNIHESSETYHNQPSDRHHQGPHGNGSIDSGTPNSVSTDVYGGLAQKDGSSSSRNKNDLYALVPHKPQELSSVLDSLKQAKLSLQQELNRLPLVERGYMGKTVKPLASTSKSEDRLDIPIGCSGLFRLPTDFCDEPLARSNLLDSASHLSSNFYLDKEISRTSADQFGNSHYFGTGSNFSLDDRSHSTRYLEGGSRFVDTKKPPFDPFYAGLPSSSNSMHPSYPIYPSYQNLTPQMTFSDGHLSPYPSRPAVVPPADNFSFYDDHTRCLNFSHYIERLDISGSKILWIDLVGMHKRFDKARLKIPYASESSNPKNFNSMEGAQEARRSHKTRGSILFIEPKVFDESPMTTKPTFGKSYMLKNDFGTCEIAVMGFNEVIF